MSLPLFYTDLVPLDSGAHAAWALKRDRTLAFAREANVVPLTLPEVPAAGCSCPVVFGPGAEPVMMMVAGLKPGENVFLSADGTWAAGHYVPAYVRRYPFMLVGGSADADTFALAVQRDAAAVGPGEGDALFVEGQPSETTRQALAFCQSFKQQSDLTADFAKAVAGAGLLVDRTLTATVADGSSRTVQGVRVVDPARLHALDDDTFLAWRRRGWLPALYAHLQSMECWGVIAARTAGASR